MEQTITLYLGLKDGQKADLEVVGLAAAAFAEAVKEISYIVDPGMEVRIEFESGTEGSLKLKAIIKTLNSPEGRRAALAAVAMTVGGVLLNDIRTYGVGKLIDRYLIPEQRQQLSDEDVQRIAKAIQDVSSGRIAKAPIQKMYKQIDRDEVIESVGTITKSEKKPPDPVPRSEFPIRAGIVSRTQTGVKDRKTPSVERLTIISPVLLHADRVWRLRSPHGEFGYHIKDEKFLDDVLAGRRRLPMKEGVQITAKIETHEEFEGQVWVAKNRYILKVVRIHQPPKKQSDLFSQPVKGSAGKKKKK